MNGLCCLISATSRLRIRCENRHTLEEKCDRPTDGLLPASDTRTKDVVQVPDQEPERKRPGAGAKEPRDGRAGRVGDALRGVGVAEDVRRAEDVDEHDDREDDLVEDGVAVEGANQGGIGIGGWWCGSATR